MLDLEKDFSCQTLNLEDDYEGKVAATLIRANDNKEGQKGVLYIHGFVDYFFQVHMAEEFVNKNYNFYALDLRKYGRSMLPHQHPNYCRDMSEYYEEITIALKAMQDEQCSELYLLGHSTGGLLACNYLFEGEMQKEIKALMLNSPFLDFNVASWMKPIVVGISNLMGSLSAYSNLPNALKPNYAKSLHKDYDGEWDFNLDFKPINGFAAYFKWSSAIAKAQSKLVNPKLNVPILVMHSAHSKEATVSPKEAQSADIVLNVEDIKRVGKQLGNDVTLVAIEGGVHDLVLSREVVRKEVFEKLFVWLEKH